MTEPGRSQGLSGDVVVSQTATTTPRAIRSLRSRPSQQDPASRPTRSGGSGTSRVVGKEELDRIMHQLGPEGTQARREELVHRHEATLRTLVEDHDMAVKEKFHLERYISILEGWDPADARVDNSPVFMEYKNNSYDLLSLIPASTLQPTSAAGPSRARGGPSRTTRRQLHAKSEALGHVTALVNGETRSGAASSSASKGKGKTVESEQSAESPKSRQKGRQLKDEGSEMPPPPLPSKTKKGRRVTIQSADLSVEASAGDVEEPAPKGKKRPRSSMPNLPTTKKARALRNAASSSPASSPAPAASSPAPTPTPVRSPSPTPAPPLPSLAHLPFPPPPIRSYPRRTGRAQVIYTDPNQRPMQPPRYGGDLTPILESYIHLEDTGPQPDLQALEQRAAREGYIRNRVNYLQHQGRLGRLLDEDDEVPQEHKRDKSHQKKPQVGPPARRTDFQDSLMLHMVQVRNAMLTEAKMKPQVCRRIARMIQLHWEHIEGKDERERLAAERELKRKGKDVVRALRKRWGLAVKIVRARVVAAQKLEQDRLGKEHLQNMLQRSTGLLEAQRDDIVGAEDENGDDDDAAGSDATDEVSAAEDSDEHMSAEEDVDEPDEGEGNSDSASEASAAEEYRLPAVDWATIIDADRGSQELSEGVDPPAEAVAAHEEAALDLAPSVALDEPDVDAPPAEQHAIRPRSIEGPGPANAEATTDDIAAGHPCSPSRSALATALAKEHIHFGDDAAFVPAVAESPTADGDEEPLTPRPRSRRLARKSRTVTTASLKPDPDAHDADFAVSGSDRDDKDQELDVEMEHAEGAGADSEDEGLLADANIPIEELLKRYGYPAPETVPTLETEITNDAERLAGNDSPGDGQSAEVTSRTETTDPVDMGDPVESDQTGAATDIKIDQSLTDAALDFRAGSPPSLIIEGKRQRRVRTVWTPPDSPQALISTKPRKREPPGIKSPTPAFTSDEEDEEDEDEDEEDEDEEADDVDKAEEEAELPGDDSGAPRVRPPFLLRGTLRPYQQAGLEWLASLYANNMNGILADEMGLGKTIQTIALLGHLACDKGVWGQHLIIVPTSVILNWEMEFKKFLPGMKVLTYYGNQKERKEKRVGWHTENAWQVCITSYQIVLADQHIFRRKNWVYMILDEAHNIKNFRSQRWQTLLGFKTQRRLLLTGTPLQNNLMELWSLLYFLMPNGITADATAVVGFANHKEFTEWFSNPMDKAVESGETIDEEMLETVSKLHTLLRPFILRRLKAEVETELPGKFEHVVYCRLSKRQRFLYEEFMSRASTREALTSGGYLGVVNTLMQLRKVCNHPDLFEVRPVRTSFAMDRGVASDFQPSELLLRKRLLAEEDEKLNLVGMNLIVTSHEDESGWAAARRSRLDASDQLPYAIEPAKKGRQPPPPPQDARTIEGWAKYREHTLQKATEARWEAMRDINRFRCQSGPIYGSTTLRMLSHLPRYLLPQSAAGRGESDMFNGHEPPAAPFVHSLVERVEQMAPLIERFAVIPPNAVTCDLPAFALAGVDPDLPSLHEPDFDSLHMPTVKLQIAFPDSSLLQYDCGKLQKLAEMLRDLKADGHRVLIFTQMTRVLDILEIFLSYNGHRYLRLDGSTKIEDRQVITERFNSDNRIFCFIASSRSGGVGINLTGADTVFFYDSDWNPSMDRQCMDRAHRIGQTREVHIYRFVSSHTVEENMLKKANQKRLLDRVVIQDGDFTTEFFGRMDWRDMLDDDMKAVVEEGAEDDRIEDVDVEQEPEAEDAQAAAPRLGQERELALALAQVEDEEDVEAARVAQGEGEMDFAEFGDDGTMAKKTEMGRSKSVSVAPTGTAAVASRLATAEVSGTSTPAPMEEEEEYDEDEPGAVDEYMLRTVEWDWDYFSSL